MEVTMNIQPHAFASTFYFFADTQGNVKKIKRAYKQPHHDSATFQCKLGRTKLRTDRRASGNSGFKKLAVQWLIEHSTSHQHLWWKTVLCSEIANFLNPPTVRCKRSGRHNRHQTNIKTTEKNANAS